MKEINIGRLNAGDKFSLNPENRPVYMVLDRGQIDGYFDVAVKKWEYGLFVAGLETGSVYHFHANTKVYVNSK